MKRIIFLTVILCFGVSLFAQTLSKTGVSSIRLRNSGEIIQNEQVKGYYYFYNVEREDRKNNNYLLSVYDENLREINSVNIVRPLSYTLIEGAFNGSAFGFLFYDSRKKSVELISYDNTLKQSGSHIKLITNRFGLQAYNMIVQGVDPMQSYLVAVPQKGFLYYGIKEGSKSHFEIDYFDNSMKKIWASSASADALSYEMAMEAFQHEEYVGSMIGKKRNNMSKDTEFDLQVQNLSDGKVLFRIPLVTSKYSVSLADVSYNAKNQNFVIFGECYDIGDKELKSQSLGFINLTVDKQGKIIAEKVNTWKNEISKAAPVNEKGKFDGSNTNILFHEIITTSDGQIFAIGEQYKKAASAVGIASQVLGVAGGGGSNTSAVQLNVYNMVIFQFDPDFTIKKVHIFEKDKNVTLLPAGATYSSSKLLSYYAKAIGGFDYTFSQRSADKSTFVITYINYDREKGEKSKNLLGSIVYTPEKTFVVDKLAMARRSKEYYLVSRAKEGYVMVSEYFRKEKRLDSRLEKINY